MMDSFDHQVEAIDLSHRARASLDPQLLVGSPSVSWKGVRSRTQGVRNDFNMPQTKNLMHMQAQSTDRYR